MFSRDGQVRCTRTARNVEALSTDQAATVDPETDAVPNA